MGIGSHGVDVPSPVEIVIDISNETANGNSQDINHLAIKDIVAGRRSSYFLTSSGNFFTAGENGSILVCTV